MKFTLLSLGLAALGQQTGATSGPFDDDWNFFNGSPVFKNAIRVVMQQSKLPGGAIPAQYLELTCMRSDKPYEAREWLFIGKENQCTFKIMVFGDQGMYKKHLKEVEF